jgi:hypothetical protein
MISYMLSLTRLEILNIVLAILAALVAFGSIVVMKDVPRVIDVTQTVIINRRKGQNWRESILAGLRSMETMGLACALVTLAAGLLGQAFGQLAGNWQNAFDTLMFGGVLAVLIANRRGAVFGEYKHAASWVVTATCWVAFFARAH